MVSITGVSAGQASHYYSADNYYSKKTGEWQGKGAEKLGLEGEVKKEDFEKLLYGAGPKNEFQISTGIKQNHRAALDLTFSAPKSVSILSEILGSHNVRNAHENAVKEALRYVETNFSQARQTKNGITEKINTGNLVIAKFQHSTSRELDPQLHHHCVLMNITQRQDGQWRALSNEKLYENKMLIGQVYRNELSKNLKDLGYEIKSDSKGLFEVQGVDQKILDHFSQRKEQIKAKVQELKKSGKYKNISEGKLKEIATLGSRVAKRDVDMNVIKESWKERLQEQGFSKEQLLEKIEKTTEEKTQNQNETRNNEYDFIRLASKIINEEESTFTKEEALKTAGKLSVGEQRIGDLEKAFSELQKDKEIVCLKENTYTTPAMKKIEHEILNKVKNGQGKVQAISTKEEIEKNISRFEALKGFNLTSSQKKAVSHILASQDSFIGVRGDAGTGKTSMLSAAKEQLQAQGWRVLGLAPTGKAAFEIQQAAGIPSQTIDSFLLENKGQFENSKQMKQIWFIDEASMLGSKKLHATFFLAEKANARVVLLGDTKQLQSISAGKMFAKLQENGMKTVFMSDIQRQTGEYKEIVINISQKKIDKAFEKLELKNKINEISDRQKRLKEIVKEFLNSKQNTVIVTARNTDRNELNSAIRQQLQKTGKLGKEEHAFKVREPKNISPIQKHFAQSFNTGDLIIANKAGIFGSRAGSEGKVISVDQENHKITVQVNGKEHVINLKKHGSLLSLYEEKQHSFAKNDRVVFGKNDRSLELKNGQVGKILSVQKDGRAVIQIGKSELKINLQTQYNYLNHGYAVTDHKAQGQTTQKVIYHADTTKGVNFNQAYVAITRGKQDLRIFTDSKEGLKEQMKVEQEKTSTLIFKELEESKAQREAIWKNEKEERKSPGAPGIVGFGDKMYYAAERVIDKIPIVKTISRDMDKNFFRPGYATELMKEREKELEKYAKTKSLNSKIRISQIEKKLKAEKSKLPPGEKAKIENLKIAEMTKTQSKNIEKAQNQNEKGGMSR